MSLETLDNSDFGALGSPNRAPQPSVLIGIVAPGSPQLVPNSWPNKNAVAGGAQTQNLCL